MSQLSTELAAAVGRILAAHIAGGDVGHLLEEMDVPILRELELHVLVCDAPMKAWLEKLGLPELRDEDTFWVGMVLPKITEQLERRSLETQTT